MEYGRFREQHAFSFRGGRFLIDGSEHPAEPGSILFVLQGRSGPVPFVLDGVRVVVEGDRARRPVISCRLVDAAGGARWEARIASHEIIAAGGADRWRLNGLEVRAVPGSTVTIGSAGPSS